jgi:hypothetical protein
MRADTSGRELTKPVAVRLPNGQILKPKVRIHFRKGR